MSWLWVIIKVGFKLIGDLFKGLAARKKRLDKGKEILDEGHRKKDVSDVTDGFDRVRNA